jgi:hypothetical protein
LDFWFENKPSGNPDENTDLLWLLFPPELMRKKARFFVGRETDGEEELM